MQRFTLTVLARDGGGEETTGRIRVNVLDVNDNAPIFQKEAYVGSLRENEQTVQAVARVRVRRVENTHVWSLTEIWGLLKDSKTTLFIAVKYPINIHLRPSLILNINKLNQNQYS